MAKSNSFKTLKKKKIQERKQLEQDKKELEIENNDIELSWKSTSLPKKQEKETHWTYEWDEFWETNRDLDWSSMFSDFEWLEDDNIENLLWESEETDFKFDEENEEEKKEIWTLEDDSEDDFFWDLWLSLEDFDEEVQEAEEEAKRNWTYEKQIENFENEQDNDQDWFEKLWFEEDIEDKIFWDFDEWKKRKEEKELKQNEEWSKFDELPSFDEAIDYDKSEELSYKDKNIQEKNEDDDIFSLMSQDEDLWEDEELLKEQKKVWHILENWLDSYYEWEQENVKDITDVKEKTINENDDELENISLEFDEIEIKEWDKNQEKEEDEINFDEENKFNHLIEEEENDELSFENIEDDEQENKQEKNKQQEELSFEDDNEIEDNEIENKKNIEKHEEKVNFEDEEENDEIWSNNNDQFDENNDEEDEEEFIENQEDVLFGSFNNNQDWNFELEENWIIEKEIEKETEKEDKTLNQEDEYSFHDEQKIEQQIKKESIIKQQEIWDNEKKWWNKKLIFIWFIVVLILWLWFFFKDKLLSIIWNKEKPNIEVVNTNTWEVIENQEWNQENNTDQDDNNKNLEEDKVKINVLEKEVQETNVSVENVKYVKEKISTLFPFYEIWSNTKDTLEWYIMTTFSENQKVIDAMNKILSKEFKNMTAFKMWFKTKELTAKEITKIMLLEWEKWKNAINIMKQIYTTTTWKKISKKYNLPENEEKLIKILAKNLSTNQPFLDQTNSELKNAATKSNKYLLLLNNPKTKEYVSLKELYLKKRSIAESLLWHEKIIYFDKFIDVSWRSNFNIDQDISITKELIKQIRNNKWIKTVLQKQDKKEINEMLKKNKKLYQQYNFLNEIEFYYYYLQAIKSI